MHTFYLCPKSNRAYTVILKLLVHISCILLFATVLQHFKNAYQCSMHFSEEELVLVHICVKGNLYCLPYIELRRD